VTPRGATQSNRANLSEAENDSYSPRGHTPITSNARIPAEHRLRPTRCDAGTSQDITGTAVAVRRPPMNGVKHKIKVLLVDDHPLVRMGLRCFLATQPTLNIVGEASNGKEAICKVRELSPDIVLMDVEMPEMDGLAVTEVLHKEFPQVKVLILSMYSNHQYMGRVIEAGARGCVRKDAQPDEFVRAIEAINAGQTFLRPSAAHLALNIVNGAGGNAPFSRLSDREREVLALLAGGKRNKEVAHVLGIGVRTIETHRERLMQKLEVRSVAGLTKVALAQGLVSLDEYRL
jgi:DNA-binding NarL/FixJ family response regulator